MNAPDYGSSAPCGACAHVVGPEGEVTVRVVDLCPECPEGHIDLSPEAFDRIAPIEHGRVPIRWQYVPCFVSGPVVYHFKDGSNEWWTALQLRNIRHAVANLEYERDGEFVAVSRLDYQETREPANSWGECYVKGYYGYSQTDSGDGCTVVRRSLNALRIEGERAVRTGQVLLDRDNRAGNIAVSADRILYTTSDFPDYRAFAAPESSETRPRHDFHLAARLLPAHVVHRAHPGPTLRAAAGLRARQNEGALRAGWGAPVQTIGAAWFSRATPSAPVPRRRAWELLHVPRAEHARVVAAARERLVPGGRLLLVNWGGVEREGI